MNLPEKQSPFDSDMQALETFSVASNRAEINTNMTAARARAETSEMQNPEYLSVSNTVRDIVA